MAARHASWDAFPIFGRVILLTRGRGHITQAEMASVAQFCRAGARRQPTPNPDQGGRIE
jgi:hypothetical protein